MREFSIGYYIEYEKYVARQRVCNFVLGMGGCGQWKTIGRWVDTKEEAEANIQKFKEIEATGVDVIA